MSSGSSSSIQPQPTTIGPFVAAQQFQQTLSHLFPNSANNNPFNLPCLQNSSSNVGIVSTSPNNIIHKHSHLNNSNFMNRIKMKRCRQRVDAGEPRNSYQSQMKNNNNFKKENNISTTTNFNNNNDTNNSCSSSFHGISNSNTLEYLNLTSSSSSSQSDNENKFNTKIEQISNEKFLQQQQNLAGEEDDDGFCLDTKENEQENDDEEEEEQEAEFSGQIQQHLNSSYESAENCHQSPISMGSTSSASRRKSFRPKRQKSNLDLMENFIIKNGSDIEKNYLKNGEILAFNQMNFEENNLFSEANKIDDNDENEKNQRNFEENDEDSENNNKQEQLVKNLDKQNPKDEEDLEEEEEECRNKKIDYQIQDDDEGNEEGDLLLNNEAISHIQNENDNEKEEFIENDCTFEQINNNNNNNNNAIHIPVVNSPVQQQINSLPIQTATPPQSLISNPKFQEIFEQHRRIYSTLMEQRKNSNNNNNNLPIIPGTATTTTPVVNNLLVAAAAAAAGKPTPPTLFTLENMLIMNEKTRTTIANLQQQNLQEVQKNFAKLEQVLKDELMGGFTGKIDKVVGESFANVVRLIEQMPLAYRQQQLAELHFQQQQHQLQQRAQAFLSCTLNNAQHNQQQQQQPPSNNVSGLTGFPNPYGNPLLPFMAAAGLAAAAAAANNGNSSINNSTTSAVGGLKPPPGNSSGIFPTTQQPTIPPNFKAFPNPIFQHVTANILKSSSNNEDGSPRKKRAKVTDTVRGPRSSNHKEQHHLANSLPSSARSSPQLNNGNNYFVPTMVNHHSIFGSSINANNLPNSNVANNDLQSRDESPANNSDDFSDDYGNNSYQFENGGSFQQKYTLTHVHLRKAKLMFFYTRYPTSSILKSYFPDIHFNKNNTAQLVKWFSNFREFFYMQMEKYAKQALAEGIRNRNDIVVTVESEIYKQLNQHYNRNNVIQPPERLVYVIQETLKEFFLALQAGKDAEPSWKKVIYKVIQQLDEPIPEYFKDPNFIETLEQS